MQTKTEKVVSPQPIPNLNLNDLSKEEFYEFQRKLNAGEYYIPVPKWYEEFRSKNVFATQPHLPIEEKDQLKAIPKEDPHAGRASSKHSCIWNDIEADAWAYLYDHFKNLQDADASEAGQECLRVIKTKLKVRWEQSNPHFRGKTHRTLDREEAEKLNPNTLVISF